jgi:hypothetical protein
LATSAGGCSLEHDSVVTQPARLARTRRNANGLNLSHAWENG